MTVKRIEITRKIPAWSTPLLPPARYKGAAGGRASGKSHFFAEEAVEAMAKDPDLRFVCIREVQRSLQYSAKALVELKIKQLGLDELFTVTATEVRRRGGSGVMIFNGMQDHTADSLKSLESFGRAWVEEGQTISKRSLSLLLPTIRAPGSEIWFSWNPEDPTDAVDKFFKDNLNEPDVVEVRCTYKDNPFCPAVMHVEADRLKRADEAAYEHIWLGGYFLGGSGRVYSNFSALEYPDGNICADLEDLGGEIYIGQDFNVNPMATVIATRVVDECHVLDALEIPTSNTEEVVTEIRRRYPKRHIVVCPDPAGKQRHTNAPVGVTDFTIMENAGFQLRAPNAAPPIVDRINNSQANYFDAETGRRRCLIHPRATPLITSLKNLVYKEGTSLRDKKRGFEHIADALDYLLWEEFNVLALSAWGTGSHTT